MKKLMQFICYNDPSARQQKHTELNACHNHIRVDEIRPNVIRNIHGSKIDWSPRERQYHNRIVRARPISEWSSEAEIREFGPLEDTECALGKTSKCNGSEFDPGQKTSGILRSNPASRSTVKVSQVDEPFLRGESCGDRASSQSQYCVLGLSRTGITVGQSPVVHRTARGLDSGTLANR